MENLVKMEINNLKKKELGIYIHIPFCIKM